MASWWCQILYVQQIIALYLGEVIPIEQYVQLWKGVETSNHKVSVKIINFQLTVHGLMLFDTSPTNWIYR